MSILITGAAGFIGHHLALAFLKQGERVYGVDSLNDYYDPELKAARLERLTAFDNFHFSKLDLADDGALETAVPQPGITHIYHLAAQAGVRYSLDNPRAYIRSNVAGHLNILEFARHAPQLEHLAYASSSSVYGDRAGGPFAEGDEVRSPASLYAATKIGGEMLSESYARLYGIPQTGLRFFTVYGPWGRPDMAYWIFTQKILRGETIDIYAAGEMSRDFTYIDDIIAGLLALKDKAPKLRDGRRHEIYNLGNSQPTALMDLVGAVEAACGQTASKNFMDKQPGDVSRTFADVTRASRDFDYSPSTTINEGIPVFVDWYRSFYKL